jgi:hypothetical protein
MKKEIKEDYRRWKYFLCSWIGRIKIVKKSNAGGFTIPDFKLYYRARAIKTAW